MNPLDTWIATACEALGIDPATVDRDAVLDLTRDVAHGVSRPAAPLTAYLVGLAAGRDGGADRLATAVAAVRDRLPGGAERPRGQSPGAASG
jgi:hypothetical protein